MGALVRYPDPDLDPDPDPDPEPGRGKGLLPLGLLLLLLLGLMLSLISLISDVPLSLVKVTSLNSLDSLTFPGEEPVRPLSRSAGFGEDSVC